MSTRPANLSSHRRKRVHFATDSSSSPANSASDGSTLAPADDSTAASDYDSDSDTSLSESSEDPSSESSSDDDEDSNEDDAASDDNLPEHTGRNGITSLRAGQGRKPTMKINQDELGPDIRTFLKDFLPQLKAANEELEKQRQHGTLKEREIDAHEGAEGDTYIEMDLGLGVLEEKDSNADDSSQSGSDEDIEDGEKERDVLGKLMGRKKMRTDKEGVVIQEVGDA